MRITKKDYNKKLMFILKLRNDNKISFDRYIRLNDLIYKLS